MSFRDTRCRLYPKLSFFFDGTGNNLEIDQKLGRLSNIAKLYMATIDDRIRGGSTPSYFPGVGTPFKVRKILGYTDKLTDDDGGVLGLGFGRGGELRIQAALAEFSRILEQEWDSGSWRCMQYIHVAVFGFSRGATGARAFVRRLIKEKCERSERGLCWVAPNGERTPLRINFMGLFDTVASVGGPGLNLDWAGELTIPSEVERCVHYVAAHEVRKAFPLDSIRMDRDYPPNCEEVIYPGVHSDVGGGYDAETQGRSNLLSRIPLHHMIADALRAGVPMQLPNRVHIEIRDDFLLPEDHPVVTLYRGYMAALPPSDGNDLESLIQPHRRLKFQWRGAVSRQFTDARILGRHHDKIRECEKDLTSKTPEAYPVARRSTRWVHGVPEDTQTQLTQLLAAHRRLKHHVEFLRNPVPQQGGANNWPPPPPRARTGYEDQLLLAWDKRDPLPHAVDALMAEHIHDSVAHFSDWPCALHDERGIFCDQTRYLADNRNDAHLASALATV